MPGFTKMGAVFNWTIVKKMDLGESSASLLLFHAEQVRLLATMYVSSLPFTSSFKITLYIFLVPVISY